MEIIQHTHKAHRTDRGAENPTGPKLSDFTLHYRSIFLLPLCKIIKSMGLEIRKLLFIPLVIIKKDGTTLCHLDFVFLFWSHMVSEKAFQAGGAMVLGKLPLQGHPTNLD